MRKSNIFETVTTRGALLPGDFLTKLSSSTSEVKHTKPEDYNHPGEKLNEVISRAWNTLNINWKHFSEQEEKTTAITRDRWLIPLFRELDYGNLKRAEKHTIDGKDYPISHTRDNVPIHLLGYDMELDHRTPGKTRQIPHSMMQEYLNRSETPTWGILSNGGRLRVLRENSSMTRQAFIEFDLEKMMESQAYSDFTLLYLICHESRFSLENKQKKQIIETWATQAKQAGIRALDSLRTGVKEAIEAMGKGFLTNQEIRTKLRENEGFKQEYYRQLLRVAYRMIFLLTAESRELLLDPEAPQEAKDLYYRYYSLTRIRNLAQKKRGTRHKDLWKALNVTISSLCKTEPTPELGIKPLGSFLWSDEATEDLNEADVENKHLCEAIRAITLTTKEGVTTRVDYRNLGSEELGSIYESLLEMRPEVNADARQFKLNITAGNERKTTGSYYTPTELINELLNSALEPVIQQKKTEQEILETRVCDPACGSGHFLIAAAHRMARHLAAKRTEEAEPDPETYRTALRDIISHCIYGVDINPMSVELCKVSLWLEAIEPGKPLNFLDHHIKCGNSLIGTSPQLMTDSETKLLAIPDDAFKPITGDDKKAAAAFKKINKQQRTTGQRDLFAMTTGEDQTIRKLALQVAEIDHIAEGSINQLKEKEAQYRTVTTSSIFNTEKTKADLWCAAFVQRKTDGNQNPITTETLRAFSENPRTLREEQRAEIERLAEKYQFFHWYIEFPEVFQRESKESSGFDVVLGNPPWEHTELKEKEFFASRDEKIANATGAGRKKLIASLEKNDPSLYGEFTRVKREHDAPSHFVRNSDRYPLCGLGRINTYAVFAELNKNLKNDRGRVGCIVPSGIATDDTTKFFFQEIIEKKMLACLYDFENRKGIFEGVHRSYKFCLLTLSGQPIEEAQFVFFAHKVDDLRDEEKRFTLSKEDIELLNPNTKTCPIFRTRRDAEITKGIYRRVPVLINENDPGNGNPWGITFKQGLFNMTSDSHLFRTKEQLESEGWEKKSRSDWYNLPEMLSGSYSSNLMGTSYVSNNEVMVPLYEGRLGHQYDYRYASYENGLLRSAEVWQRQNTQWSIGTNYYVPYEQYSRKLSTDSDQVNSALLGFRRVSRNTDERTCIASILPPTAASYGWILTMGASARDMTILCALYNSFIFDYLLRCFLSQPSIPLGTFMQIAAPNCQLLQPFEDSIVEKTFELIFTSEEMRDYATEMGYCGEPFVWNEERRRQLMCELDALFFKIYGIDECSIDWIMDTFPIVKEKELKQYQEYRLCNLIKQFFRNL